mgnify:CR=1 FL=1
MGMKQISTFIAAVILVLLTVAIGVTLYLYFSGYLTGMRELTEQQKSVLVQCQNARLDIDYSRGYLGNLTLYIANYGDVTYDGNFTVRIEYKDGSSELRMIYVGGKVPPGNVTVFNIGVGTGKTVTKVTVTPVEKCQIPYSETKEVTL